MGGWVDLSQYVKWKYFDIIANCLKGVGVVGVVGVVGGGENNSIAAHPEGAY